MRVALVGASPRVPVIFGRLRGLNRPIRVSVEPLLAWVTVLSAPSRRERRAAHLRLRGRLGRGRRGGVGGLWDGDPCWSFGRGGRRGGVGGRGRLGRRRWCLGRGRWRLGRGRR